MTNVIGMNEFSTTVKGGLCCWLCQKQVTIRALFCHHCGTIQPVRELDHFARLGVERRIDIQQDLLEQQYAALSRTLNPQRFIIRGMGERGHAAKQLEALTESFETLRDPLRRSRYWLALHNKALVEAATAAPMVGDLRRDLDSAADPAQCDRVAQKAGQALEEGIMGLMQALRGEDWQQANTVLVQLDGIEAILGDVRARRTELMVGRT
jgi:molecular chaperone HscB